MQQAGHRHTPDIKQVIKQLQQVNLGKTADIEGYEGTAPVIELALPEDIFHLVYRVYGTVPLAGNHEYPFGNFFTQCRLKEEHLMCHLFLIERLLYGEYDCEPGQEVDAHRGGAGKAPFFETGTTDENVVGAVGVEPGKGLYFRWLRSYFHCRSPLPSHNLV
jgi:hypothetical protein